MEPEENNLFSELKAQPVISFAMIFLLILIVIVFGAVYFLVRSKNISSPLSGRNLPRNQLNPLAIGRFVPIIDRAWEVVFSYNTKTESVAIKNAEVVNTGVRQDFRPAQYSPYSFVILNDRKQPIYSAKISIATDFDRLKVDGTSVPLPEEITTFSFLPLYNEGKTLIVYKDDKKIAEGTLPQQKKSAFQLVKPLYAQANAQQNQFKILILGDGFTNWGEFNKEAADAKAFFQNTEPFSTRSIDVQIEKIGDNFNGRPTECVAIAAKEGVNFSTAIKNCYERIIANYGKPFSQVVVIVDPNNFNANWVQADNGSNVYMIQSRQSLARVKGFEQNGDVYFAKMLKKHILGAQISHLYTRSVNDSYINNKLMGGIASNCSASSDGERFWLEADRTRVPTRGCNGSMNLYAPYPPGDTPACQGSGSGGQRFNGNSHTVMSNEWSDCGGLDFDPVERFWIKRDVLPLYTEKNSNECLSNCSACGDAKSCNDKTKTNKCFWYTGRPGVQPVCLTINNSTTKGDLCLPSASYSNKGPACKNGCYCKAGEGCGYDGCVEAGSGSTNEPNVCCDYTKELCTQPIANLACSKDGSKYCSKGACCNSGQKWDGTKCVAGDSGGSALNLCPQGAKKVGASNYCRCQDETICDGPQRACRDKGGGKYECELFSGNKPDFTIQKDDIVIPASITKGKEVSFRLGVNVRNNGATYSQPIKVSACLDAASSTCKPGDSTELVTESFRTFNSANLFDKTITRTFTDTNNHSITVCVNTDSTNPADESDKTNNCATKQFSASESAAATKCREDNEPLGYYCIKDGKNENDLNGIEYASYGDCPPGKKSGDQLTGKRCMVTDNAAFKCEGRPDHLAGTAACVGAVNDHPSSFCDCGLFCQIPGRTPEGGGCCSDQVCDTGLWCEAVHKTDGTGRFICVKKPTAQAPFSPVPLAQSLPIEPSSPSVFQLISATLEGLKAYIHSLFGR